MPEPKFSNSRVVDVTEFVARAVKLQARGASMEEVLAELRAAGASPVASIKVLADTLGATVSEAKQIVWNSQTWADKRPASEAFEEELIRVLGIKEDESP